MLETRKILVVGDVMLDTYYYGDVKRISPEAPVPVFRKNNEKSVLGGAANVAANLVAAGQNVTMMTIIGKDEAGKKICDLMSGNGIDTEHIHELERKSTSKIRFLAENNQQVMRLDIEDTEEISTEECDKILKKLKDDTEKYDLIVISDYLKGMLTYELTQGIIKLADEKNIKVIVDVKDANYSKYAGAYLLKPNLNELAVLSKMKITDDESIYKAAEFLLEKCNVNYILATCGARGMRLVGNSRHFSIESVGKEVYDVTGAGDTTISYLAACLANEFSVEDSVKISNVAAGLQVAKVGTSAVKISEVENTLNEVKNNAVGKLLSLEQFLEYRKENKKEKIVFTNGCFDILHVGHIKYLQEASKLGDKLVVGLNSDMSVKRLKGEDRPINTQHDRAELLAALGCIDFVIIFDEDTPYNLIKEIEPDILVKGGDYKPEEVVGKDIVENKGGKLVLIDYVDGKSTTNIIEKIKE